MDSKQFRECGKQLVDFIADYLENIRSRKVFPDVEPGFMKPLVPKSAPEKAEPWEDVFKDIERVIMPGMTHWASPNFFFPLAISYPSICAEILTSGLSCFGLSFVACPSLIELEMIMMDWLAQAINLPEIFFFRTKGPGGGIIQPQSTDSILVAFFAARRRRMLKMKEKERKQITGIDKFVAYTSDQSHSAADRTAFLSVLQMHIIPTRDDLSMIEKKLTAAIKDDKKKGLIPTLVICTLGSNSLCAFDNLAVIGPICAKEHIWLHVDASYAGSALICPELRYLAKGIETVDSFVFYPQKWLLTNFDSSIIWVKNREEVFKALYVDQYYFQYEVEGKKVLDFRHCQLPFSRGFYSLKLWFVFRMHGVHGLQIHIRNHIWLALQFEKMVRSDSRFEILYPVILGAVCFRLKYIGAFHLLRGIKNVNDANEKLLAKLYQRGHIHIVSTKVKDRVVLQFIANSQHTALADLEFAWEEIKNVTTSVVS